MTVGKKKNNRPEEVPKEKKLTETQRQRLINEASQARRAYMKKLGNPGSVTRKILDEREEEIDLEPASQKASGPRKSSAYPQGDKLIFVRAVMSIDLTNPCNCTIF